LNLEKTGFNRGSASQPPQQACKAQHQFALDGGLRLVIGGDGLLEGLIVLGILQRDDDGLGGQSMTDRILRGAPLAKVGLRTGAAQGIAPVASIFVPTS
jgi:hypothetical protein